MKVLPVLVLAATGILGAGCFPKAAPVPGALSPAGVAWATARWPGATAASLTAGRDQFVAKCNGCHGYPDLPAIADDRWPAIVESMGNKAHLGAEEKDAVLHYVLASRQEQAGR